MAGSGSVGGRWTDIGLGLRGRFTLIALRVLGLGMEQGCDTVQGVSRADKPSVRDQGRPGASGGTPDRALLGGPNVVGCLPKPPLG